MGSFRRNRSEFGKDFESSAVHEEASSVTFRPYTSSEIKQLSACHVFNTNSFNQLGHPIPNGLYDLKMGPFTDRGDLKCATCLLISNLCPGHVGHIELPLPVCNPLFYSSILRLLKMSCMTCHTFRVPKHLRKLYLVQQTLLDYGNIIAAQGATEMIVLPSAQDLSSLEDEDKPGGRKSKVDRSYDEELIKEKLDQFLKEELQKSSEFSENYQSFPNEYGVCTAQTSEEFKGTRNIEALRKAYNKQFLTHHAKSSSCPHCGAVTKNIVFYKSRFIYEGFKLSKENETPQNVSMASAIRKRGKGQLEEREKTELTAQEIKDHFRYLWQTDQELLSTLFPMLKQEQSQTFNKFIVDEKGDSSSGYPTDIFFVEVLAVPPPNARPCQYTGGSLSIHPQSISLTRVLETVTVLKEVLKVVRKDVQLSSLPPEANAMIKGLRGDTITAKMDSIWKEMQADVDRVLDREMSTSKSNSKTGWGFKQLIERKHGLFRMHMMGKRVNFAARTVITPDPNIAIDEIGLPEVFAKKLSYRVPVTPNNVEWLRKLVMNGPDIHPGAIYVESGGGKIPISATSQTQREALAKTLLTPASSRDNDGFSQSIQGGIDPTNSIKYVWRHLINGDAMLLNRQPTLHKPSIMSHRARVLKGEKVMRLHYAICKSYNADFDGDEMNAHFPQNEVARSEAYNIVNVCKQYLVPKDGTPLQGLIQDHVIAGVKMTIRGRFFSKAEYQQHVFSALDDFPGRIKVLPPAILKPQQLWSGKQIISTIVLNLVPEGKPPPTLLSTAKVKSSEWEKSRPRFWKCGGYPPLPPVNGSEFSTMSESEVIFRNGEFLAGVLDKNQFGATQYSLTHAFFELYGGYYSGKLLSALSKIFTNFLHTEGFTLGVRDILVTDTANDERKSVMAETCEIGDICAANAVGLNHMESDSYTKETLTIKLEEAHREGVKVPRRRAEVDKHYKDKLSKATNQINKACLPKGLITTFPNNNLQLMVQAGAKGSTVNTMQISCLLGQIELEGKRPPLMISGKSLPSFKAYDTRPIAGGFIDGRFMTGIKPQEFFFHCMAGREGLIDTAVKTSRSGYLQRCLIKLLEGVVVSYDGTVRDSDGSIIQFQYGEDSMDVCKSQYLKKGPQLDFLADNIGAIKCEDDIERAKNYSEPRARKVQKHKKSINKWKKKNEAQIHAKTKRRIGGYFNPSSETKLAVLSQNLTSTRPTDRCLQIPGKKISKLGNRCPDPVVSLHRPESNFSSVTEAVDDMIENYLDENKLRVNNARTFEEKDLKEMFYMKVMQAQVEPGEPVGVLAAQSVGEPSTQMTLNTFHFAGRGEMNVTLGIPRLREILMVASTNIKTPSLTIPFSKGVSRKTREKFKITMNRCSLADVLEVVHVTEKLKMKGDRARIVTMKFEFLPRKSYKEKYCISPSQILDYFERRYISKVFMPLLSSVMKDKKLVLETGTEKAKKSRSGNEETEDDDMQKVNTESDRRMDQLDAKGTGELHASSDEEDLADDADASDARKKFRQADEDFDDGLSDEELNLVQSIKIDDQDILRMDGFENEDTKMSWELNNTEMDDGFEDDTYLENDTEIILTQREQEELNMEGDEAKKRRLFVRHMLTDKGGLATILDYTYDTKKELWCKLTLSFGASRKTVDMSNVVRKSAERAVLHEIKNIKRGIIVQNEKGEDCLQTEGVNIDAMFKHENILDLNRLYCNNIHDMARYYGIEAANKTIVKEIVNVFKAYGIDVDKRHLSLIADYMTFDGSYKPFNRIGIENNPSPLQQMTFETAIGFLRSATLAGKCDTLDSPSSRLVVGKPCNGGTGTFGIMQKLICNKVEERNSFDI